MRGNDRIAADFRRTSTGYLHGALDELVERATEILRDDDVGLRWRPAIPTSFTRASGRPS
jgi:hypothetical protein